MESKRKFKVNNSFEFIGQYREVKMETFKLNGNYYLRIYHKNSGVWHCNAEYTYNTKTRLQEAIQGHTNSYNQVIRQA